MNLDWIAGFFDGEGSVSAALVRHPTAVYGYKIGPRITLSQKTLPILKEVQRFLGMGALHQAHVWNYQIRRRDDCLKFVQMFAPRSRLKSRQLLLLKEVLDVTNDGRQGGIGVYLPKDRMLRALELVAQIRNLNGNKHIHNDLATAKERVVAFDEKAYRTRSDAILAKTTLNILKAKSPEHRRKIGEALRRFRSAPEVKEAYSMRMRGSRNPQFGKKATEKQLQGLKLGWGWNKGRKLSNAQGVQ